MTAPVDLGFIPTIPKALKRVTEMHGDADFARRGSDGRRRPEAWCRAHRRRPESVRSIQAVEVQGSFTLGPVAEDGVPWLSSGKPDKRRLRGLVESAIAAGSRA